jgi:hypothetical protein
VGLVVSDFERMAVGRVIARAQQMGLDVPREVASLVEHGKGSGGAMIWTRLHPDDDTFYGCCWGEAISGPGYCTCWVPVFDDVQADPAELSAASGIEVRPGGMCEDCAYRPRSPERSERWGEEALLGLPSSGSVFWCHQGMRRPVRWVHPDGREVPGSPEDYRPPIVKGVPFRMDGQPGLFCAGWAALARREPPRG